MLTISQPKTLILVLCSAAKTHNTYWGSCEGSTKDDFMADQIVSPFNDELFLACMRRFLYIRCYNSIEFLSALKASTKILNGMFEYLVDYILQNKYSSSFRWYSNNI